MFKSDRKERPGQTLVAVLETVTFLTIFYKVTNVEGSSRVSGHKDRFTVDNYNSLFFDLFSKQL